MLSTATRDEGDGAAVIVESLQADDQPHLRGKRILVVEDEFYIADDVYRLLKQAGAEVVGPVSSFEAAERVVDQAEFDCAVLDLNLHGQSAICIADRLAAAGRAYVIATGYGSPSVPERLKHAPRIEKPFEPAALLSLIAQISCAQGIN